MKIFSCEQIRQIDAFTIQHEPVSSIDLMERAAGKIFSWLTEKYSRPQHFTIFCGPGNNGGDGLAVSRMLSRKGYPVDTYFVKVSEKTSPDFELNSQRLQKSGKILSVIENSEHMPVIASDTIIIDAIFGSGLTRPAEGLAAEVIRLINLSGAPVIAVDVPSGLFCENNLNNDNKSIIRARYTLSFQFRKLAFMFAENNLYTGECHILPIGLDETIIRNTATPYSLIENGDVLPLLHERKKFDHKGDYGHALLVAGSYGKMGAAVLGATAALRTGTGLLSCHIPACGYNIMQTCLPEAMVQSDSSQNNISNTIDTGRYSAVGVGPGIGTEKETHRVIDNLLSDCKKPMVVDADALNILSLNKDWLSLIPPGTILTPHPGEFRRLTRETGDSYSRLMLQMEFSARYNCIVILKGAHTSVALPDGRICFNSTGNPGMATGGSGDVLTGILLSLLAQGYSPESASLLGVYLHGMAGDLAAEESSYESIIASDIINCIGKAFNRIRNTNGD